MKNFCLELICCIFAIIIIFPGNYARCQYTSLYSTMEDSPPIPQLYDVNQNIGDEDIHFVSVTAFGNILYIPIIKTLIPSNLTTPPPYGTYQPINFDSQYMIRAIDFANPEEPKLIKDIDMDLDIDSGPLNHLIISGEYLYLLGNETDASSDSFWSYSFASENVNFSIYKIQNNEELIATNSILLDDILDSLKEEENEIFYPQLLKVVGERAYIIVCGTSISGSPEDQYPSEVLPNSYATVEIENYSGVSDPLDMAYYPIYEGDINAVETGAYTSSENDTMDDQYSPEPFDVTDYSYPSSMPENNTAIVTIDIKDPSDPKILGITRLQITCIPADMDLLVDNNIGYFLLPSADLVDSKIHVLDLSSPNDILEINSINPYGKGGQLVKEGDNLYMASKDFGLQIFDISTPTDPTLISLIETPFPLSDSYGGNMGVQNEIIVKDGYVYMLDNEKGLLVIDVTDPENPNIVSSYLSRYISGSDTWWYSAYTSVDICGDHLFLPEIGRGDSGNSLNIVSIADPLSPVSIGIIGERSPQMLTIALSLDVAELLDIHIEQNDEGDIALFGISSLDDLNREYGVFKIDYPNNEPLSYYLPYYASMPPLSTGNYDYPPEDIRKDRDLRTFYLTFPGAVDLDKIVADYQENPYVITAKISMQDIYQDSGYYGDIYMPTTSPYTAPYPLLGSAYGFYGDLSGGPYSGQLYGGFYGDSLYSGALYGSYSSIPQPYGYQSSYGYSSPGMYSGLITSYPTTSLYDSSGIGPSFVTSYPSPNSYPLAGQEFYSGYGSYSGYPVTTAYPSPYSVSGPGIYCGYGSYGSYSGFMPHVSVPSSISEPNIQIGEIHIEGDVHIGELYIGSEPSNTPDISIAIIPDEETVSDSDVSPPDDLTSSDDAGLFDTIWSNITIWPGKRNQSSSLFWDNLSLPSSATSWIW